MASGNVLAIPFPPIRTPLLGWRPPMAPVSRREPSHSILYASHDLPMEGSVLSACVRGPTPARWRRDLRRALRGRADGEVFRLALQGLLQLPLPGSGELATPGFLAAHWRLAGVVAYDHQLQTARRVLMEMGGRALLADEVGLGKTIEAAMVLHELILRRLVHRALILVPAGLLWQWYREMRDKFGLPVELQASAADWERAPLLVASLDTAKRPPHREAVLGQSYDLVVVDEAHRLKNARTRSFQLVAALKTRYLLLLTATPVHNTLRELHALAYLVAPERVGEYPEFARRFGTRGRHAEDPAGLRKVVATIMVRHRRARTPIPFTGRTVHTVPVELSPSEKALYDALDCLAPAGASSGPGGSGSRRLRAEREPAEALLWLTLKREACSSPWAAGSTLRRLARRRARAQLDELATFAQGLRAWGKGRAVADLVRRLEDEHVLVFTEFRETQQAVARHLATLGRPVVLFYGDLTPMQREWAQSVFRERAPVMVSTDAGAEGVNLQFCRHLINVDLPWNPMRIEQRIGRVHRLGQTRQVHIWNVYAKHTIEEYVLHLLHDKLDLFRTVVGELDQILEPLGGPAAFERALGAALLRSLGQSPDPDALEAQLRDLIARWEQALEHHRRRQAEQERILDGSEPASHEA